MFDYNQVRVDIEPTNRCNADCYFCPREMTPDEGLLKPHLFDAALARTLELDAQLKESLDMHAAVSLCGLGEPLINKHTPEFVAKVRDAELFCAMSSNGALLDERRGRALLDAGLQEILINVGEKDEGYEEIYKLPWERTRDNVLQFAEMAGDDCSIQIVLVDHREDPDHQQEMRDYWTSHGLDNFVEFGIMNRGGSLEIEHADWSEEKAAAAAALFDDRGGVPACVAPFKFPFVGYDGLWYLCCSDWTKTAPFGSVLDTPFVDTVMAKLQFVKDRAGICQECSIDPLNRVIDMLDERDAGTATNFQLQFLLDVLEEEGRQAEKVAAGLAPHAGSGGRRRSIPVTVK